MSKICSICSGNNARYLVLSPEGIQESVCSDCARHLKNPNAIMDNPSFWSQYDSEKNS
jgi:hypothetical protein